MKSIKLNKNLLLILILVGLSSLRFINLSADPVPLLWLHNQDEGNYSYNTRNLVLENKLVTDDVNFFFVSPLWTTIQFPIVKTFGIHFESFRFPAALSPTILAVAVFIFLWRLTKNRWLSFLGGLLIVSDFLILVHSRFAMPETTNLLFLTLGFISWYVTLEKYPIVAARWSVLTGLFWTAAFLTKGNGISLGLTLTLSLALLIANKRQLPPRQELLRLTLPFLIFGLVFLGTRLIFKATYPEQFAIATIELTEKYRPLIRSQILNPAFWQEESLDFLRGGEASVWIYAPFLVFGAAIYLTLTLKKLYQKFAIAVNWYRRKIGSTEPSLTWLEIEAACFLICSLFWFLLIVYKPARYFLLIVPALIIANVLLIKLKPKLGFVLVLLTLFFDAILCLKFVYTNYTFEDKTVEKQISQIVGKNKVAGGGLDTWTLNATYSFLNTYFSGWDEDSITNYFDKYGWPNYLLMLGGDQIRQVNGPTGLREKFNFIAQTSQFNNFKNPPQYVLIYKINRQTN